MYWSAAVFGLVVLLPVALTLTVAAVINLPWLNRIDEAWVADTFSRFAAVVTLDNHYVALGQGVMIAAALAITANRNISLG